MTVRLQAPHPAIETTTFLPNPEFSDVQNRKLEVQVRRSMDNTKRTYVKSNPAQQLSYTFDLTRLKSLELRAFVEAYYRVPILVLNHKDELWVVNFTINPFEFNAAGRAHPVRERVTVILNFEGIKQ